MKKITFDFLATMELKAVDKPITALKADLQPAAGADLRLFSDGAIYPSQALVEREQLEYQSKNSSTPEYGYDVFLSSDWAQYDHTRPAIVCIAKVSKHLAKVDLFSRVKYDENDKPKNSVLTQKNTSGEQLIHMLETVYCEDGETLFDNGRTFVDLKIVTTAPIQAAHNGIYLLPKKFVKGKQAGQLTYERRESIQVYGLDLVNFIQHPAGVVAQAPKAEKAVPATPAKAVKAEVPETIVIPHATAQAGATAQEIANIMADPNKTMADAAAALFGR